MTWPIYRHADLGCCAELFSLGSSWLHSSDFEKWLDIDIIKTFLECRPTLLISFRSIFVCFSLGEFVCYAEYLNKILKSFCWIPECSAARPSFYHVASPGMLEPRLYSWAAQSACRYNRPGPPLPTPRGLRVRKWAVAQNSHYSKQFNVCCYVHS